uniref:C-type lectin domain family 7 member A-like isoform X2 n=1 Tax=Pristiophorus japonicus TaxID=55135 RepID=UPI00398E38B5
MAGSLLRKFKRPRFLLRSEKEVNDEQLRLDDSDSVRRPDSVPNLEDYEGTMVGMNISERTDQPVGMAAALDNRPGSEGLASSIHGMQATFMDEIGLMEGPSIEKTASEEDEASGWREACRSNWSKLALALLALCAILAICILVLHVEGAQVRKRAASELIVADAMEEKNAVLKLLLVQNMFDPKCTRYEDMFLRWLQSFCQIVNCTSQLCHKNWTPFEGNCYYFSKSKLGWDESRQECISEGSELVVIRTDEEQKFVAAFDVDKVYWIGIKEVQHDSTWMWIDGTYLLDNLTCRHGA